jgi:hypothetical protein
MTYAIQGGQPDPILEYDVTDAATGAPMRVTILGGVVSLVYQRTGMFRVDSKGAADNRQQMGFFVPGPYPVPHPDPLLIPELSLAQVGVYLTDLKTTRIHGVADVRAQVMPDPQRGGQRWVYMSFTCIGTEPLGLRYRLTMYRPRG